MSAKRKGAAKDYTAPVNFVSGGVQQSGKNKKPEVNKPDSDDDGNGKSGIQNSSESEEDVRPSFKPQQTAGMRQPRGAMSQQGIFIIIIIINNL
jgi:hypothetical protein